VSNEKQNLAGETVFFRWRPAAWLRVGGEDAATFLQGQFSNDLRKLEAEPAVYGLWLNHKGRVLADSFVLQGAGAGEFWVGSYFSSAAAIRERLEAFVIADDVTIEDAATDWAGVTLFGALASEPLFADSSDAKSFPGRRGAERSTEWIFSAAEQAQITARLAGARELEATEMESRRILGRVPAVPVDLGPGDLPNEGLLERDAVSYTKGCYLGQEVMARLKSMGQVRRRLLLVRARGPVPPLPAAIYQGERKVGELRSAVREGDGLAGLALLSLVNLNLDTPLSFSPAMAGTITLVDRP
jgi:folate-binding protein YgfZ